MRLHLEHIGPLREASIDLAHDFILLTGPNGTGKTFAAYCVNNVNFSKDDGGWLEDLYKKIYMEAENFENFEIQFLEHWPKFLGQKIIYNLPDLFAQAAILFNEAADVEITLSQVDLELLKIQCPYLFLVRKLGKARREHFYEEAKKLEEQIAMEFYSFMKSYNLLVPNTKIFPVERVVLTSLFQSFKPENDKHDKGLVPRYTKPVRDHLEMLNDMINLSKNTSELAYLAEWLETELLKGKIVMSRYGEMQYKAAGSKIGHSISVSASITKSLASLVFYFRHLAKAGDRIIIDEPELNLHPDNQRIIARFLVRAMNAGVKILISTHSDHLIRELNNLMMLGSKREDKKAKKLMREYKYKPEDLLDYTKVGAYLFLGDTCEQLEVEETGFEVATIDKAINDQNEASNSIYFTLFD